jgi:hypothetical protein
MLPIGSTGGPVRQHRIYPRSCALFKCVIDVELGLSYDLSPETALNWLEERRSGGVEVWQVHQRLSASLL